MDNEYLSYIVSSIREVLNYSMPVVWSWGAENFRPIMYKEMPSLEFNVSGYLHKGKVVIAYNGGADLYEVYCLNEGGEVVESRDGVYCDELVDVIDKMVETSTSNNQSAK